MPSSLMVARCLSAQFVLWFPPRSCSLKYLLCQRSCISNQILWTFDSTTPSLCIKLRHWQFKSMLSCFVSAPQLTRYVRARVGTGYCQLFFLALLATGNRAYWLLPAAGIFFNLMAWLSHNSPSLFQVCGHAPLHSLRQLAELDYRKSLVLQMTWLELHSPARSRPTRFSGKYQKIIPTVFLYVRTDKLQSLVLSVCFMLECHQLIFKHY